MTTVPDLRQMRYVIAVAEERSFTRAAQRLHVSQQALSQQVRVVEDLIGVQLFDRTNRVVELTRVGEVFLADIRRVVNGSERAVERAQAAARGEVGALRLGYTLTVADETLPTLLATAAEALPKLRVRPQEVYGADLYKLLREARFDAGIAPRVPLDDDMRSVEVREERLVLLVGDQHRLAARRSVNLREVRDEPFVVWRREIAPGFHDAVVAACAEAGFVPTFVESDGGSLVWSQVAANRGVALSVASINEQLPGGIRVVPLRTPDARLAFDLVWCDDVASPGVRRFAELVDAVVTREGWR